MRLQGRQTVFMGAAHVRPSMPLMPLMSLAQCRQLDKARTKLRKQQQSEKTDRLLGDNGDKDPVGEVVEPSAADAARLPSCGSKK